MASSKSRQRQLARAKYERQLARKAQNERRRRQLQAGLAGVLVVLVTVGAFWLGGAFDSTPVAKAPDICLWTPKNNADGSLKDAGTPSTTDVPTSGTRPMNINLTGGPVEAELNLTAAPCTAASFAFLAAKGDFFNNTKCTRLTGAYLQCGDPGGTGTGGPTYQYLDENTPVDAAPPPDPGPSATATADPNSGKAFYPKGTIATYNTGPGTNGSQFLVFYQDAYLDGRYSKFGTVTKGLDVVEEIATVGAVDDQGTAAAEGKPKNDVLVTSLTVGEVIAPSPQPTPGLPVPSDNTPAPPATTPTTSPTAPSNS